MPMLHSQGTTITFDGSTLARFQKFGASSRTATKTINAIDGTVESGVYVPVVEPTTKEQTFSMEGLATSIPAASLLGSTGTLAITGSAWSVPAGRCVLDSFDITGSVGEYLRITFQFRRTAA